MVLAAFELFLLLERGGCCRLRCLGTWLLAFFFFLIIQKKTLLLKEMGERQQKLGTESYEVEGKLLTDLNPSSVVVFFVMSCLYLHLPGLSWMEDKIFRQQETKRRIWNYCPVSPNMAENTLWPFGMLQLKNLLSVSQSASLSACCVCLSDVQPFWLNFYCKH